MAESSDQVGGRIADSSSMGVGSSCQSRFKNKADNKATVNEKNENIADKDKKQTFPRVPPKSELIKQRQSELPLDCLDETDTGITNESMSGSCRLISSTASKENMSEEDLKLIQELMSDELLDDVTPKDSHDGMSIEERFGQLEIFDRPVRLIYSDDDSNNLKISETALEQISSIDVTLNVVAICGLYRTGKSYLLNRLAGERKGFSLGSTVKSETKGIWAWCRPHPTQKGQVLLLLDTEGMGDIDKGDTEHDNMMFSLTMLLCSTLIYNNSGVFNQDALEKLAFITQLTKKVQVLPTRDEEENDNDVSIITPVFILCLRDFFLELKDTDGMNISADKYFEGCLSNLSNEGKDDVFNRTRCCIRKYFPRRKCFTLTQPAVGKTLARIEEVNDEKLDEDFITDVTNLQEYVYTCENKVMDGVTKAPVRGSEFDSLTRTYVAALQNGSLMTYEKAYEEASKLHNSKLVVNCVNDFKVTLKGISGPATRKKELGEKMLLIMDQKLKQLREKMYPYKVTIFEEKAKTKMKKLSDDFQDENGKLVQHILLATLEEIHANVIKDNEYLFDQKRGSELYREHLDILKATFLSKMHEYDEDELIKAMASFKLRIKDEKMRIVYQAKMHEEKERNEMIQKEMEKNMSVFFDSKLKEMAAEQKLKMEEDMRRYERNLDELSGEKVLKKKSFFERFRLLFI